MQQLSRDVRLIRDPHGAGDEELTGALQAKCTSQNVLARDSFCLAVYLAILTLGESEGSFSSSVSFLQEWNIGGRIWTLFTPSTADEYTKDIWPGWPVTYDFAYLQAPYRQQNKS